MHIPILVSDRKTDQNAYAERVIPTIQKVCLDHSVVLCEKRLKYLLGQNVTHFNTERPHSPIGRAPCCARTPRGPIGRIERRERLGGLPKHYYREAA